MDKMDFNNHDFDILAYLREHIMFAEEKDKSKMAEAIQKLENPPEGFRLEHIYSKSGCIYDRMNLDVVFETSIFNYSTTRCGDAYHRNQWFYLRETGKIDIEGREIYETPDHRFFVIKRWGGSPSSFSGVEYHPPRF